MFGRCRRDILRLHFTPQIFQIVKNDAGSALVEECNAAFKDLPAESFFKRLTYFAAVSLLDDRLLSREKAQLQSCVDILTIDECAERKHVMCVQARHRS